MSTTKLGGYLVIVAAIGLLISQLFDGIVSPEASGLIAIWSNTGFTFGVFAFCYYFIQDDKDNGFLYLIPILALMGWTANTIGLGIGLPRGTTNIDSVNALASMSGAVGFSAGFGGFLSNALLGYYIFGKPQFNSNIIYKIVTAIFIIGSLGFVALGILIPLTTEGREVATVLGEAGKNILPFDTVILAFIWIPGIISTLVWTIWTGIIFVKK
tara:strand:+ start:238 stop:876 length:639 start_codon:yes stop_codon:yes gene_type:complete